MEPPLRDRPCKIESAADNPLRWFSAEATPEPLHVAEPEEDAPPDGVAVGPDVVAAADQRLSELEDQIARLTQDGAQMKSDLATLVSAIEDIKRQQGRPPSPLAPGSEKAAARVSAAAAAITILMLGFAAWGALTLASYEQPETPPVPTALTGPAVDTPVTAAAVAPSPPVATQNAAVVETAPVPVRAAAPRPAAVVPSEPRAATQYIGTLTIDAEPAGEVFINRKSVGRTPVRLEGLRAGSHLVWIERDGYRRWTRVVAVAANRISRVSAELDPITR
jgi:hypothetical protein